MSEKVIFKKNDFSFERIEQGQYLLRFSLENQFIDVSNIIDFSLIPLIFDLNKDLFDFVHMERTNETEAIATIVTKNLFEDIGFAQRYLHVRIEKQTEGQRTTFLLGSIRTHCMPPEAEELDIEEWVCECQHISSSRVGFVVRLKEVHMPSFVESLVGTLSFKVFDRVKRFIENVRVE